MQIIRNRAQNFLILWKNALDEITLKTGLENFNIKIVLESHVDAKQRTRKE